ncbi:MAG: dTDP-4-dehydrorhamnose 3,5-epimerase [Erysipelotrichaceae bacterium]|nr:dTDP-4-dehydrorhamnose 3,5-epimerase [Erysipelotrichaceae bacterium]
MKVIETYLDAIKLIQLDAHGDERGYFVEIYNQEAFAKMGVELNFVQDNCSFSAKKGTIRGLHFQNPPYAQAKLIRCTKGRILDISVDVRKGSPTFGKATVVELCEHDHKLLLIPHGFAHGVAILEDNSAYNYKVDNLYNKDSEGCLRYDYDASELDWQRLLPNMELILSQKDQHNPSLDEIDSKFIYEGE